MSEELEFFGSVVKCYVEDDVIIIGIGDHDMRPEHYVIISRLDEDDEPIEDSDFAIGLQTHLSEEEVAGAIAAVNFESNRLQILIAPSTAKKVGASRIQIALDLDTTSTDELITYLHEIFDDAHAALNIT